MIQNSASQAPLRRNMGKQALQCALNISITHEGNKSESPGG